MQNFLWNKICHFKYNCKSISLSGRKPSIIKYKFNKKEYKFSRKNELINSFF